MLKDDNVFLAHMLEAAYGIEKRVRCVDRSEFDQNEDVRIVFVHLLEVIGEAAGRISEETRSKHPSIPWELIIGMRHRIVHDYINVKYGIVWEIVVQDIPFLVSELRGIVKINEAD